MLRRSAPRFIKCVAKLCLNVCGETFGFSPFSKSKAFKILKKPCLDNLSPLEFKNSILDTLFFSNVFLYILILSRARARARGHHIILHKNKAFLNRGGFEPIRQSRNPL